ncbi:hypothetical protein DY023_02425 [Microbacterium bovistercoris]|uniref:DUF559 domain-containing protein n=1 Tax=Microbacterium bovistercoris TaxID=2293570 RepID=A0A371NZ12_9MICO|nr:hypothetical protein [Microbacterium bovistercoris]REJ07840.1 hypothetical protein DY023_02425 [Microbacterium bovistercoris]
MTARRPLPDELDQRFGIAVASASGVARNRMRASDLDIPFPGVRRRILHDLPDPPFDPYERQAHERLERALDYAPRLTDAQFVSHESAAAVLGAPLPMVLDEHGEIADLSRASVHVSVLGTGPLPRCSGVIGHRANPETTRVGTARGIRISDAATTWASLAHLQVPDLVAVGDYFCRRWRPGVGRKHVGRRSFCTIDDLRKVTTGGRRRGIIRLREAVELVREDSWSPRETKLRLMLCEAHLPEPQLNIDVRDDDGRFLGCVDLAYPELKVAIEYQSMLHGPRYAADVERIAALRAAGWIVIEVTSELFRRPDEIVRRVRAAISERR